MSDDDDDREGNEDEEEKAARERLNATIDRGVEDLRTLLKDLGDLNSRFPVTQEFLRRKGVSNVMELSPEDRLELNAYLQAELAALRALKTPSN